MGIGPLYIGGLSYSGKTQLSRLLIAHADILITRRTYLWKRQYGRFGDLSDGANLARCLDAILAVPGVHALEPDRRQIESVFGSGSATYERLFTIIHDQHAARRGARRWGDQLGGVEQYAGIILTADETARLIHMVRDPRGRLAMIARSGRRPGAAGWEMHQWRQSVQLGLARREQFPDRYLLVRYEDLREWPEATLRQIGVFLDEPMVNDSVVNGTSALPSLWDNDPFPDGRAALGARTAAYVERHAVAQMAALGYEPGVGRLSLRQRVLLNLVDEPVNQLGGWIRKRREAARGEVTPGRYDANRAGLRNRPPDARAASRDIVPGGAGMEQE